MNSPIEEYRFLKNVDNIGEIAYFTLFEKYILQNLKGENKLIEVESTDQESLIISKNGGWPIPGMIYTFLYGGPDIEVKTKRGIEYYSDLVPIVFCMNNERKFFSGINLNVFPENVRLQFLSSFYETFKDFLEKKVDELAQNQKLALNRRCIEYIKSGKGQEMIKLYSKKNAANFNFGYRKYDIKKIKQLRMIEYSEWNYIPFYNPKDAFRKLNQRQIYKLYRQSF